MINQINSCAIKWLEEQTIKSGIIQQLNAFCCQGGGIARQIANKYPQMVQVDNDFAEPGDPEKMGKFCFTTIDDNKYLYGYFGQYDHGCQKRQTDYEAVYNGLMGIREHAIQHKIVNIGMPKLMGCALGGGDWRIVEPMINVIFENYPGEVYICFFDPMAKSNSNIKPLYFPPGKR